MKPVQLKVTNGATISACGLYRYRLWRGWDHTLPPMVMIMLNPSTADANMDDPTVRRCVSRAKAEGCGSLDIINLFAYRSTDPMEIRLAIDPVGPENDRITRECLAGCMDRGGKIVAAWGNHGTYLGRAKSFLNDARMPETPLLCLGFTKNGQPRHPLYVPNTAPLLPWDWHDQ